jgi:hypothetical protein
MQQCKFAADNWGVPLYVMVEHLLQVALFQVLQILGDEEKEEKLVEHLKRGHLASNKIKETLDDILLYNESEKESILEDYKHMSIEDIYFNVTMPTSAANS